MDKELKIKLIESLARMEEGQAVREVIEDFIDEIKDVTEIKKDFLNDKDRTVSEIVGRQIAIDYLRVLTKTLKPLFKKEAVKKNIR